MASDGVERLSGRVYNGLLSVLLRLVGGSGGVWAPKSNCAGTEAGV